MKTNELIKKVETIGLTVDCAYDNWMGFLHNDSIVADVDKNKIFSVNTDYGSFHRLDEKLKKQLYELLTEYASTPIEKREEEKKYMYRLKKIEGVNYFLEEVYLNWDDFEGAFYIDNNLETHIYKTVFTHSWLKEHKVDIKQLKEIYDEIEATK